MGDIIDLRELIPDDLEFIFPAGRGEEPVRLTMPGDLPNDTVWTIYRLLLDVAELETSLDKQAEKPAGSEAAARHRANKGLAQIRGIEDRLEQVILETFRIHQPDLEVLPCGKKGSALIAEAVLKHIGFLPDQEEEEPEADGEEDPTVAEPETGISGSSTTGSSRSSKRSDSRPTRGGGSATGRRKRGTTSGNAG